MELIAELVLALATGFGSGFWVGRRKAPGPEALPVEEAPQVIEIVPVKESRLVGSGNARRIHMGDSRRTRLS